MTYRWATTLGTSTAVTAVALALAAAGGSDNAPPSRAGASTDGFSAKASRKVPVENCSTRSQADFPGAFTARRNLVVGPLAMIGAGRGRVYFFPDFASDAS